MIEGGFGIRMNAPPPSRLRAALTARLSLLLCDRNVKKTGTVLYCKPMNTETFSVRLDRSAKVRLQKLAKSTGRSRAFLAAEAIVAYLDTNEWQVAGITKALASLDRGKGIAHARVSEWIASWETQKERRSPRGV
jgi:RHH-type rel operon transcriptional repressor/antitoxin RelB